MSTYTVSVPKQQPLSLGSTAVLCQKYRDENVSLSLKCRWAKMLHRSVTKCCLFHYVFIAHTRTSFEKFQTAFYFHFLFSFSGFSLSTSLRKLKKDPVLGWA